MSVADKANAKKKKAKKRNVPSGVVHIYASFNNTMVTVTDNTGAVIASSSAGNLGFKGSRKSTPFAAQMTTSAAMDNAREHGLRTASVVIKGPGTGRESALRALQASGVMVTSIRDTTPIPHNGCRAKKRRRV